MGLPPGDLVLSKQLSSKVAVGGFACLALGALVTFALVNGNKPGRAESPTQLPTDAQVRADLPDFGPAPDISDKVWINSDPLRLADLRGKVVMVNFWTFECINCQHVLPYVRQWHDTYSSAGLVIIGVHFPEFAYEADLDNLKNAVKDLKVSWPVAQDNDGATWNAYRNQYWPTLYLIDKRGDLRYTRIGEGGYSETDAAIQALLAETYTPPASPKQPAA